ncbi:MAG: ATP-binding protein [Planctomycetota bacterium]
MTQIDQLRQQVQRLQTMATLGELTGTATHEFNNVLMTVINYAKLGLRNRDEASREKALNKILEASQRAALITNTILAQARNRGDAKEAVDLNRLIGDTLALLQREMQKYRVSVETQLGENLPPIYASGNQIQRVLINLMTNARQAMPDGGALLISTRLNDESNAVELTVRDNGCGIDAATLPRIFDPYFTTKSGPDASGKGGTGIGLAACKEVIDEHEGRVRVESTPGRGTAFVITLPLESRGQAAA